MSEFRPIPGFTRYEINWEGVVRRRLPARNARVGGIIKQYRPGGVSLIYDGAPTHKGAVTQRWTQIVPAIASAFGVSIRDVLERDSLPDEEWRPVVGYEELYDVSTHGRVRRMAGHTTIIGKILRNVRFSNGYEVVTLSDRNVKKIWSIHRLVAKAFIPNPDEKPDVNHIDGVKHHNGVENLEWAEKSENTQHAYRTGLAHGVRGAAHRSAKFTPEQIVEIRASTLRQAALARQYGCSNSVISEIRARKTYKNVP